MVGSKWDLGKLYGGVSIMSVKLNFFKTKKSNKDKKWVIFSNKCISLPSLAWYPKTRNRTVIGWLAEKVVMN